MAHVGTQAANVHVKEKVARFFANLFKRKKAVDEQVVQPSKHRSLDLDNCIFCELPSMKEGLRQFSDLETCESEISCQRLTRY